MNTYTARTNGATWTFQAHTRSAAWAMAELHFPHANTIALSHDSEIAAAKTGATS